MISRFFEHIEFFAPQWLWLLVLLPLLFWWQSHRKVERRPTVLLSTIRKGVYRSWKANWMRLMEWLRFFSLACLIISLARPGTSYETRRTIGDGIDIMLCLDVSGSMLAQDFRPNRLEAAKEVAIRFVASRPADRMGLVIFSGESFTQCPLTTDHRMLTRQIESIRSGLLEDGTAIGSGMVTSLDRLRSSAMRSKVLILLTDGENNGGLIDPVTAKEMARTLGIRVYTIGIGSSGIAPTPVQQPDGSIKMQQEQVNIDEGLLTSIATETGGRYYRARDNEGLNEIYQAIDRLEKTKVEVETTVRFKDRFQPFALLALLLLGLELLLRYTVFRTFP
jgi:Ca-activated chloride channel family protein